ncbi:hypothetical protein JTE90_027424 [Oedothorax gibbosus]|uniref:Uncharacterized protein n=1 Tax=Oedothorax gibbosus TaxID=931172 RepID=A0AAV6W446_9ARAC|nr:hypothetical protein JTE90_027424 [Oedothorax gibbosus]
MKAKRRTPSPAKDKQEQNGIREARDNIPREVICARMVGNKAPATQLIDSCKGLAVSEGIVPRSYIPPPLSKHEGLTRIVWKNFENGKVYSHKMPVEKKDVENHGAHRGPVVEERLLHSHHRDKKLKTSSIQTTDPKPYRKNPERHHKKSIEEEMHLRPLNERHHKFPNPVLLDKTAGSNQPSSQINEKVNNRRRQRGGRRYKRNRLDKTLALIDGNLVISTITPQVNTVTTKTPNSFDLKISKPKTTITREGYPLKISSYW